MKYAKVLVPLIILAVAVGVVFFAPLLSVPDVGDDDRRMVNVSLVVDEDVYRQTVLGGSTAHQLMLKVAEEEAFSFTGTDSSFGLFIDSINGIANDADQQNYWTLYLNDEMAQAGVLDIHLTEGDVITWKYEHVTF